LGISADFKTHINPGSGLFVFSTLTDFVHFARVPQNYLAAVVTEIIIIPLW
jgi:hypothetical protein